MRKVIITLSLLLATQALLAASPGKQIQCWTDDQGKRSCGDTVPPQYAKKEREYFNDQGMVVDTKSRQLTPEEQAEQQKKEAEAAAELKRVQEQAAYDKFLTDTYNSTKELEKDRDLRTQTLDGRIGLAKKAIADNEKTLADLRGRVDAASKGGKKPDKNLLKQVRKFEKSLAENQKGVEQLQEERANTVAKFNKDIERYKVLRPGL